jgi:hypothetical protein
MGSARINRLIFWLPRLICMAAIIFMSLFALDAFQPGKTIWQQIFDFLKHMIPSFILLGLLVLAWKRELIGGILFIIAGIYQGAWIINFHLGMEFSRSTTVATVLSMALPFIIAGALFIIGARRRKKPQG